MYMQWNKCTKLSPFYKLCFVMGWRGDGSSKWYAYRNKHEGKSNTKMNILTGIKMNTFSTPNRAKFLNNMQHFNVQCDHISRRFELGIQYGNTSQSLIFRTNIWYQSNIFSLYQATPILVTIHIANWKLLKRIINVTQDRCKYIDNKIFLMAVINILMPKNQFKTINDS